MRLLHILRGTAMNNKSENYISIGEMAKMNQTTVTTLRLYDSMGLLKPCYIDENSHYRYYDIKQNARFDMIQYMKELGMELREIKDVFDQCDLNLIEGILRKKKEQTRQQLIDMRLKIAAIDRTIEGIERYRKSPPAGTITLEYIQKRKIYAVHVDTNFYDYNIDTYELILKKLKNNLKEFNIPTIYYCNAGTIMAQKYFGEQHFYSDEIFIFADDEFPVNNNVRELDSGMYACIYTESFDDECAYAAKLLDYCHSNNLTICGDYICEEINEMNIFDSQKRSMYLRLQVPVEVNR